MFNILVIPIRIIVPCSHLTFHGNGVIYHCLTDGRKSNLHHLWEISVISKMAGLTPKLGIEYNMRNIFLGKTYTKCGGETIPGSFSKKS